MRELRPREYLTAAEVETLIIAARKRRRYGHRDATNIVLASRRRLRVSELIALRVGSGGSGDGRGYGAYRDAMVEAISRLPSFNEELSPPRHR